MPIEYNNYIKKPDEEIAYDIDQIKELKKCKEDYWYFTKYIKIIHPDLGRIQFKPRDYQKITLNNILSNRYIISLWSRQSGKCVHKSTNYTIRNKKTGEIINTTAEEFHKRIKKLY